VLTPQKTLNALHSVIPLAEKE